ncbi:ferrochelatase [Thermophagus sp. OGC60D27]|uniref:ferrochelatase n=1 Tax=Thermophagus sp. OGC60D27 TaxID=3458415 RepID=UPI0040377F5B
MTKKALLLANLGSPNSFKVGDVRKYLREFLMDERVIDLPFLPRWLLVNGIIAPFRAPRSAKKYQSIWTEEGSPLIVLTQKLVEKVAHATKLPAYMCMRYGSPSPREAFEKIVAETPNVEEVVLFPLYPHYAMSSYETAVEHVKETWQKGNYNFRLKIVDPFYNHPLYIKALSGTIHPFLKDQFDHLLFSYHGIPERHILKSDPTGHHCLKVQDCCQTSSEAHQFCYRHQVFETTRLVAKELNLSDNQYSISFQSRLGNDQWLGPATADMLSLLPSKGVKNLLVVTPAFVSDCLETLEEIRQEGRETFIAAGGETFRHIPCLNLNDDWVRAIAKMI